MGRVAIDLLGGDGAPEVVADAVAQLIADGSGIDLVLVGPPATAEALLRERGIDPGRVRMLAADQVVPMGDHPLPTLRNDTGAVDPCYTSTVAARAVLDGHADAWVTVGHTGAAVMSASLVLGRVPGMSRAVLAVVVPGLHGPVVLLDAGASLDATAELLGQFAVAGWCYARALGVEDPGVGLLTIGAEPGKGDVLRAEAYASLVARLPERGIRFVGNVEGHDLMVGSRAQVVVTDGFTGNVLLKGIEGTVAWARARLGAAEPDQLTAQQAADEAFAGSDYAGGMLLGVQGVTVVGHGAGTAHEIADCVRLAHRMAVRGIVADMQRLFAAAEDVAR